MRRVETERETTTGCTRTYIEGGDGGEEPFFGRYERSSFAIYVQYYFRGLLCIT